MQKFRKLDIFKKVPTDLSQKTNLGGFISILIVIIAAYFTYWQIKIFFHQPLIANLVLDDPFTRQQLVFPCQIISLDLQDQMMSHHANIGSVKKYRLNSDGQFIDSDDFQLLRQQDPFKQYQMIQNAFKNKYGCRLKGQFSVKEVPGNFHISSHAYSHFYLRLSMQGHIDTLDVSHKIHYLFFGNYLNIAKLQSIHPGTQLSPLNSHYRKYDMNTPHSYVSHYHIDIVPTSYTQAFSKVSTYQYTYMHNTFEVDHMPALYFNYHIGGTKIVFQALVSKFSTFFINMCAIIGGIYALGGIFYRFLDGIFGNKIGYQQLGQ